MSWTFGPHGPIESLDDGLWLVQAPLPHQAMSRTCTVARMSDGRLVIHSAIAMDEASMATLESWGEPAFLIVPGGMHRMDAPAFKDRYPGLTVLCPAGARQKVDKVVPVDGDYSDFPDDPAVSLVTAPGCQEREGVMEVRTAQGVTLVFNDLLFNLPHAPGFSGFLMRMLGSSGGPRVTPLGRMLIVKDKGELSRWMVQLSESPDLVRLVPGHGLLVHEQASDVLAEVAAGLR